jgi:signal transduction histidine kinase
LGKSAYYLLISLLPFVVFLLLGFIYESFFGSVLNPISYSFGLTISILFSLAFEKLIDYLKKEVNSKVINPGYDPYDVLEKLNNVLTTKISINTIITSAYGVLERTMRPSKKRVIIFSEIELNENNDDDDFYKLESNSDFEKLKKIWIQYDNQIFIKRRLNLKNSKDLKKRSNEILEFMKKNDIEVVIPLKTDNKLIGMIVLGEKNGNATYNEQDAEFLNNLAKILGLSITRSLYYEEVKELNKNLQLKVNRATENLREQNKNLEMALQRLERLRQQEQDMLDIMGHELRTPITIVRNALSVLKMQYEANDGEIDKEKFEKYLDKSIESTRREIALIETLLAATKVDAHRIQLELEKVDMIDVVEDSIEGQKRLAEQKGLYIRFNKPDEELFGYADRTRIQEIQDNLLSNAVKYTPEGGITIDFQETTDSQNQPMIKVNVSDTGIGIPKEDISKLGRKFFRAKQYISKEQRENKTGVVRPGGTGLGLYVTFELVRTMGGEIEIDSEVGEGSTFSYTIPKYTGQETKHIDQTFDDQDVIEKKIEERRKKRVSLIEEDDKDNSSTEGNEDLKKNYEKLKSANDIITKISKNKRVLNRNK